MDDLKKQRAVSDLYLIAVLSAYGIRALRIDRSNPNRQQFIFDGELTTSVHVLENGKTIVRDLTVDQIETYFLVDSLWFPGNYTKALKDIRATIHGYREDHY